MELLDACTQFLIHCENVKKLSPLTIRAYRHDLACFREAVEVGMEIENFTATWIEDAVKKWSVDPDLKMTTIKRRSACIKAFARWLFPRWPG